ncbi:hypothetical protein E2F47_25525 [Mycobacterium eburneum]|nr:hypothetical protein [Mycobacterium eburneum]TDH48007.1 hypothetical protein E2F47_25525 [Mycobacterium eburneum]
MTNRREITSSDSPGSPAAAGSDTDELSPLIPQRPLGIGPVSRRRQRRTRLIASAVFVVGLLPSLLRSTTRVRAAGAGLLVPGGGFWATRRPLAGAASAVAFLLSVVAWVASGMTTGPIAVWLGTALGAARTARRNGRVAEIAVPAAAAAVAVGISARTRVTARVGAREAQRRNVYLADLDVHRPEGSPWVVEELTLAELHTARVLIDMAVQPVDEFEGFLWLEQFQPSAVRYQICHLSYALAHLQYCRTPALQGYMELAQRNLIKKLLVKRVWRYWALENGWGNLDLNHDPVPRDNIMLTGFMALALGMYGITTGRDDFDQPGALTFRWNTRKEYDYNFAGIAQALHRNYRRSAFGLFPCEPNWIYSICNTMGALGLASYDRTHGTDLAGDILDGFRRGINEEFTAPDGRCQVIRSKFLGWNVPVASMANEAMTSAFIRPIYPGAAARWWEMIRREFVSVDAEGTLHRDITRFDSVDTGSYRPSELPGLAYLMMAAREMGDDQIYQAARRSFDEQFIPRERGSILAEAGAVSSFTGPALVYDASPQVLGMGIAMGMFGRPDGFYDLIAKGRPAEWRHGPQLSHVPYPDVLVARAETDGTRLDAVLHPGDRPGAFDVDLAQLVPGRRYAVTGATRPSFVADAAGTARLTLPVSGRTEFAVSPVTDDAAH